MVKLDEIWRGVDVIICATGYKQPASAFFTRCKFVCKKNPGRNWILLGMLEKMPTSISKFVCDTGTTFGNFNNIELTKSPQVTKLVSGTGKKNCIYHRMSGELDCSSDFRNNKVLDSGSKSKKNRKGYVQSGIG